MNRGRPRSEASRRAILDAALRLCERDGYGAVTLKSIAAEAGTGRQTLYRWWSTKAEVFLEVLTDVIARRLQPLPRSADPAADLEAFLIATFDLADGVVGRIVVNLMAEAQSDPELAARFSTEVIALRRNALRELLERYVPDADPELAVDMVFGTMWYRLLNRHAPVDSELATDITALLSRIK
ncbi:MAG TPA: TetR/AcrR family transcriptional regulator [Streptosporangiaceae bacterium]|jgi:AcrR family transcriptional regulator